MRDQIKVTALDLLIQHGYRGVSFGDIATALNTTRANIHYHFGSKQKLVEEVLEDYVAATLTGLREALARPETSFRRKIEGIIEISRRRYAKYNRRGKHGRPWSLIARMRQDSEALTPKGRQALKDFARELDSGFTAAILAAKARGEFTQSIPVEDVALQFVSIANSAGPITQDAGSFDRLEQLYLAFVRIVEHAYGNAAREPPTEGTKSLLVKGN